MIEFTCGALLDDPADILAVRGVEVCRYSSTEIRVGIRVVAISCLRDVIVRQKR
jgi:hypothetical protein